MGESALSDRTILVTGAGSGIGLATSRRVLREGGRVVGVGRTPPDEDFGESFRWETLDLGDLDPLPAAFEALSRELPELDGLVANVGMGRFGSLEEHSATQIRELVDLNFTSQVLLARAFLPAFKGRRRGDLIFLGSEAAVQAGRRGAVYSATKFALRGLAEALRLEGAKSGVRVSIIHPGMVRTEFFDDLAFEPGPDPENALRPEDVAAAVLQILKSPPEMVFDEIRLSPLKKSIHFKDRRG